MRYPTIGKAQLEQLVGTWFDTADFEVGEPTLNGSGELIDLTALEAISSAISNQLSSAPANDRDRPEGLLSQELYAVLSSLPINVLDDGGFWRYLAVTYFWDFIVWREATAFESKDYGKVRKHIDGTNPAECVLLRSFIRGQICGSDKRLASAVTRGADFWRSHIIRVRTASAPVLARALVTSQASNRMNTTDLRQVAKRLNRVGTNVVLLAYGEREAAALVEEIRGTDG